MQVNAVKNQSLLDLAIQVYGNSNALAQVLADNVKGDFELSAGLIPGTQFSYDIENGMANKRVLRRLNGQFIMTYKTNISNENIITEDGFNILTEDGQNIVKESL